MDAGARRARFATVTVVVVADNTSDVASSFPLTSRVGAGISFTMRPVNQV